jgi:Ribbon-helix-helix protein, copG family
MATENPAQGFGINQSAGTAEQQQARGTRGTGELVTLKTRVPSSIAERLEELARAGERSMAGELRLAIERHLALSRGGPRS